MDYNLTFKSGNDNYYLYNYENNTMYNIHPLFAYLVESKYSKKDKEIFIDNLSNDLILSKFTRKERDEYFSRYIFFKDNKLLDEFQPKAFYSQRLSKKTIVENMHKLSEIVFEVTEECNLNCYYCSWGVNYKQENMRNRKKMPIEFAYKIIKYFAELWNSCENLRYNKEMSIGFYGGEPLLNIEFIEKVINFCKTLEFKQNTIRFTMTTNGILLDKHIEYLVENDVVIYISLDGNVANNSYRVDHSDRNTFNKVFYNVKLLQEKYPKYFFERVFFLSVLHNKNSIDDIYVFFKKEFKKLPIVSSVSPNNIDKLNEEKFNKVFKNVYDEFLNSKCYMKVDNEFNNMSLKNNYLKTFFKKHGFSLELNDIASFIQKQILRNHYSMVPSGTCVPFVTKRIFITTKGKLLLCERVAQNHIIGEVNEEGVKLFTDQWVSKYNKIYDMLVNNFCLMCYRIFDCPNCFLVTSEVANTCKHFLSKKEFENHFSENVTEVESMNKSISNKLFK
jgi:uncharacterized protein